MSANEIFTKQNVGAVVGAVGGAWLGSNIGKGSGQIAAIAAGTLLGGFVGKSIGTSLDKADQIEHANAYDKALESSEDSKPVLWSNPKTGNSGKVTPTKTYKVANGSTCKEYKESITVGGEIYEEVGKACRQPDGTWKVM
ncbi:MAG: RT0821/Lpp0805 family surface protein [Candidatus Pacebacteria bacterium]|nr:RT0821/Lpp0805 family surface protein [Candidatus Paceibacterota bacterium]